MGMCGILFWSGEVTHWLARIYGYFTVDHLTGLFVFCQGAGGHCGHFYLCQVSFVQVGWLQRASTATTCLADCVNCVTDTGWQLSNRLWRKICNWPLIKMTLMEEIWLATHQDAHLYFPSVSRTAKFALCGNWNLHCIVAVLVFI